MPRPTMLTEERLQRIVALLRAGNSKSVARAAAGISENTFYNWVKRGEAALERHAADPTQIPPEDEIFVYFVEKMEEAIAEAEAMHVANVLLAARGSAGVPADWRASAWYLERRHPERWAKKQIVSGDPANPLTMLVGVVDARAELLKRIEQMQMRRAHAALPASTSEPAEVVNDQRASA